MAPRTKTADAEVDTEGPRSKRKMILEAAIDHFGKVGFEQTKWSTVADEVGIGQTALYHYFESKNHCLLTIMRMELDDSLKRFKAATASASNATEALRAAVASAYEGNYPRDALQRRILQSHVDMLASPRPSEKEETERNLSRTLVREIEQEWADLIRRGIKERVFVDRDPDMTAALVLAMIVSVWRWYRPGGKRSLPDIAEFVTESVMRMVLA
ncbi:TetR/AcrR family transcriptional regulator [Mycolicibacterium thermoresistibile]|uniref:Transcriptional regulator, TetR family protein n=2 Tax=Mycolicibacterium thermoresistibile TaxID=1797 RepID=G7CJB3_MYCT3|nr:TetR/AcrR family transcriptional regulator [Mycolicibacterium thermoresistibile]EHI12711.1 transcriptional regulator, TetR family protein [Mycolicibacterium thermoresistibile ATCC 19527]MCV7190028.1 TetR/AcrR family transcriptional regulator [Mycolicibacterium thermoresistibile]GAT13915.1 transcriptional regulator [Mycolicibacterium thermoresistibile]SNW19088.1 TetR family transcriptional regulator [Mycolicibacterium thermoresistibile]